VAIIAGSKFFANPGPKHHVRLAFSHATPAEIGEGVRRVAEAVRAARQ
jgi:2-aminoadipate transaminase